MFNLDEFKEVIYALVFGLIAGIGGAISYVSSTVTNKTRFTLIDLFVKSLSSGFAGLLIGWLMIYFNYPISFICAVSGCAGYFGAEVCIALVKRFVIKKLDIEDK